MRLLLALGAISAASRSSRDRKRSLRARRRLVVYRGDLDDEALVVDASRYPAVFPLDAGDKLRVGECAATLVTPQHALTAAHCFAKASRQKAFRVEIGGAVYDVAADGVHREPCFSYAADGPNGHDSAVIVLDRPAPVAPVLAYAGGDEVGTRIAVVGWGDSGPAGSRGNARDEKLRAGGNVVDRAAHGVLYYDLADPSGGAEPDEALAWSGDSGGPALVEVNGQTFLAGTNSGGDCCDYGSVDQYKRVSDHYAWIRSVVEADPGALDDVAQYFPGTPHDGDQFDGETCVWCAQKPDKPAGLAVSFDGATATATWTDDHYCAETYKLKWSCKTDDGDKVKTTVEFAAEETAAVFDAGPGANLKKCKVKLRAANWFGKSKYKKENFKR